MVYLIGASGHAKVIMETLTLHGTSISGVYDDNEAIVHFEGVPCKGKLAALKQQQADFEEGAFVISIGNNHIRKKIAEQFQDLPYLQAIHPKAIISASATIGAGTVVMAGAILNASSAIGKHVIVNTGATIDHDCVLHDFVHLSPNATLSGDVQVGEGTHIGAGAVVIQGIRIGKWATIGAGAVVIRDVPDGAKVVGNPARGI
jgi:acetyltransferase EpsM